MSKERKNRVRISIFFPIPLKHGEKMTKKQAHPQRDELVVVPPKI